MNKRFAIFDLDGTLVDSMGYWTTLAEEYLRSQGIERIPQEIKEQIEAMTLPESAALFTRYFQLEKSPRETAAEMYARMEAHYREDVPLLPGRQDYLRQLRETGVRMCVASSTAANLVENCLICLGIRENFEFVISCEQIGAEKDRPDVYLEAVRRFRAAPQDTAVYEDALYAARTAKQAGFYVVGVYDRHAADRWEALRALADETLE